MSTTHPLIDRFARAKLPLELARAPLGRGDGLERIVQLDIRRKGRAEHFTIWPGDELNRLEVEGVDRDLRQLVLLVHEPARRFTVEVGRYVSVPEAQVVRRQGWRRWVQQVTQASKRHFLLGLDEAHLFIAQLRQGVSAVGRAHEALKGQAVRIAEATCGSAAVRQGEWFFVRETSTMQQALEAHVARGARVFHQRGIAQASGMLRPGRAHVADEVLVIRKDALFSAPPEEPVAVFVRGSVRHPDHATRVFREWHRALGNTEARATVAGLSWVD